MTRVKLVNAARSIRFSMEIHSSSSEVSVMIRKVDKTLTMSM